MLVCACVHACMRVRAADQAQSLEVVAEAGVRVGIAIRQQAAIVSPVLKLNRKG